MTKELTDAERALRDAYAAADAYNTNAWRQSPVEDARRRKRYTERDPEGREQGTIEESEDSCAGKTDPDKALSDSQQAYADYVRDLESAWKRCGR